MFLESYIIFFPNKWLVIENWLELQWVFNSYLFWCVCVNWFQDKGTFNIFWSDFAQMSSLQWSILSGVHKGYRP